MLIWNHYTSDITPIDPSAFTSDGLSSDLVAGPLNIDDSLAEPEAIDFPAISQPEQEAWTALYQAATQIQMEREQEEVRTEELFLRNAVA